MPFNGAGVYTPPGADFPAVASTLIESAKFNNVINDIATGLSTVIAKDGQTTITANLPMAGFRHTGVGVGTSRTHYADVGSAQDSLWTYAVSGGAADVQTLTLSPAVTAYVEGQLFGFRAGFTNATTTPTLNVNSGGAKTIVQQDGSALAAGSITAGRLYLVQYYNNNFRLSTSAIETGTWTPSCSGNATYTSQVGQYTKLHNLVHVYFSLVVNVIGTGDNARIYGLPFTVKASNNSGGMLVYFANIATASTVVGVYGTAGAATLNYSNLAAAAVSMTNLPAINASGSTVQGSCTYLT